MYNQYDFMTNKIVTGFKKSHLPRAIINVQKHQFEVLYLGKENRCLHAIHHNSIAIHSPSMHQLLNGYLAELPAILDSFFHWHNQYYAQALLQGWRVGSGGELPQEFLSYQKIVLGQNFSESVILPDKKFDIGHTLKKIVPPQDIVSDNYSLRTILLEFFVLL